MDLTEEVTKTTWQEYTEQLYKKELHGPDNHSGVITHLKPNILECEVKWPLESITIPMFQREGMGREEGGGFRMGSMGIPVADSFRCLAKLMQYCKV